MEERKGYRKVETSTGYYWVKEKEKTNTVKIPFFCPHEKCGRLTASFDDDYVLKYGVCKQCYILYVEERKQPLIDIDFYSNRLKERGY